MVKLSAQNKLRDVFNIQTIAALADDVKKAWPAFDHKGFLDAIVPKLDDLGLGERSILIRDTLANHLPKEFPKAIGILLKALGPELKGTKVPFEAFVILPRCALVSKYGKNHFDLSMKALYEMTKRFTAEGDLRTFIEIDYDRSMTMLHTWCADPNPHVRRLVSEGTRPRH